MRRVPGCEGFSAGRTITWMNNLRTSPSAAIEKGRYPMLLLLGWLGLLVLAGCSKPPEPTLNLYRAIQVGDLDQIKRHLYWGTDINQPDPAGDYPLHVAAVQGEVVIAETLIDQGARVEVTDRAGHTPLFVALREGKTQVAELLVRRGARFDAQALLIDLVAEGVTDRDSLRYLQKLGANVNALNGEGKGPLHIAAASGNLLLCKRLIGLGADINLKDGNGRTPLEIATAHGNQFIVELLKRFGATGSG